MGISNDTFKDIMKNLKFIGSIVDSKDEGLHNLYSS